MDWRALQARVDGKIGRAFGENVRLSFLKGGAVDPTRPAVDIRAVLAAGEDKTKPIGPGDYYRAHHAVGETELHIDRSTYTGPSPVKGDRVKALERDGAPWFEVASVHDRFSNLLVLRLGEA